MLKQWEPFAARFGGTVYHTMIDAAHTACGEYVPSWWRGFPIRPPELRECKKCIAAAHQATGERGGER